MSLIPLQASAHARRPNKVVVVFNKPVLQLDPTGAYDALNPSHYTLLDTFTQTLLTVSSVESGGANAIVLTVNPNQVIDTIYSLTLAHIHATDGDTMIGDSQVIVGVGIPSDSALGAAVITQPQNIIGVGIASDSAFGVGSVTAPWVPSNVAGLRAWYKADALTFSDVAGTIPCINGDLVANWGDSSSAANNATNGSAVSRPTFVTNVYNGKPAVRFNDPADNGSALFPGTQFGDAAFTVVAVVVPKSSQVSRIFINQFTPTVGWALGISDSSALVPKFFTVGTGASLEGGLLTTGSPNYVIGTFQTGASGKNLYVDSTTATATGADSAINYAATQAKIGGLAIAGGQDFIGDILELIVWDHVITAGDITNLASYLHTKWGTP